MPDLFNVRYMLEKIHMTNLIECETLSQSDRQENLQKEVYLVETTKK